MPPTSSSKDDAFDLDGLDLKPSGAKSKSKAAESDFEKELEALFAEELASSDEKPASAPPVGGPEFEEDALLLDDLVDDAPLAPSAQPEEDEDDILDLSAFADGGELDIAPPDETPGGKDGDIDLSGLDELITGLGEKKPAAARPEPEILEPEPLEPEPLDSTDMADLLEPLDVPKAAAKPQAPVDEAEEDLLELSLGDLVEEAELPQSLVAEPELASSPAPMVEAHAQDGEPLDLMDVADSMLDLTLPDLSDPDPGRDLVAEQEQADMGGDLNLSLPDMDDLLGGAEPQGDMGSLLDGGDLDMTGLMEGIEPSADEAAPEAELFLNPQDLLDQLPDSAAAAAPVPAESSDLDLSVESEPVAEVLAEPAMPLADAALGAAAAAAVEETLQPEPVAAAEAAPAVAESAAPGAMLSSEALAGLEQRLAELATQVTGGSVAVVRLEGQLAERDAALADLEQRLLASQEEARTLREELGSLRTQLEDSLGAQLAEARQAAQSAADKAEALAERVEGAEKVSAGTGERLALLEDRQTQLDREIFAEISRAVPREAARVIREEIAHLAASMRDE